MIICLCIIGFNVALSQLGFGIYTILNDLDIVDVVIAGKLFNMISYLNALNDPLIQFFFNDRVRKELTKLRKNLSSLSAFKP